MSLLQKTLDKARTAVRPDPGRTTQAHGLSDWYANGGGMFVTASTNQQAQEFYRHNRGWVNACVRVLSRRISSQPSHVGRRLRPGQKRAGVHHKQHVLRSGPYTGQKVRTGDSRWFRNVLPSRYKNMADDLDLIENHPLLRAIEAPNEIMVQSDLIQTTVANLELTGRAFWWVYVNEDDPTGKINIWPLPVHWFTPVHKDKLFSHWIIKPDGLPMGIEVPAEQVIYFKWLDPGNPFGALGTLEAQAKPVSADESIADAQYRSFVNGMNPGIIIKTGRLTNGGPETSGMGRQVLTDVQRDAILNAFLRRYQGTQKHNLPVIVDGMIDDIVPYSMSPREMDYLNSGRYAKERVIHGFGVSGASMGQIENANRASSAVADEHVARNALNPIIVLISETVSAWMGPIFGVEEGDLIWFIEECHGTDPEFDFNRFSGMYRDGLATMNEARQSQGLPPVKGGDVFVIKSGMGVIPVPAITDTERPDPGEVSLVWGGVTGESLDAQDPALDAGIPGEGGDASDVPPDDLGASGASGQGTGTDAAEDVDALEDTTGQDLETLPELVLNGAQISSALEIVSAVAAGQLPRDAGIGMLMTFFNLTEEQANTVMGSVGAGFVPTPEGETPPPADELPPQTLPEEDDEGEEDEDWETPKGVKAFYSVALSMSREERKGIWLRFHGQREMHFSMALKAALAKESKRILKAVKAGQDAEEALAKGQEQARKNLKDTARPHVKAIAEWGAAMEWEMTAPRTEKSLAKGLQQLRTKARPGKIPAAARRAVTQFTNDLLNEPYWEDVADRHREQIARIVRVGVKRGDSPEDIAARLEFEIPFLDANSAARVARTETTGALGAGGEAVRAMLEEDGIKFTKVWSAIRDDVTREAHEEADEQEADKQGLFTVGGEKCRYPGDVSLSAGNRVNCRCKSETVIDEDEKNLRLFFQKYGPRVRVKSL